MDAEGGEARRDAAAGFAAVMASRSASINIVFSLDSVITAVRHDHDLPVMIAAVVASTAVMLFAAKPVGDFIRSSPDDQDAGAVLHPAGRAWRWWPTALGFHLPRGYIYFAIAFSLFVEALNIAYRRAVRRSGTQGQARRIAAGLDGRTGRFRHARFRTERRAAGATGQHSGRRHAAVADDHRS